MRKSLITCLILTLILFTAFIKNSTKRIDDEIFANKENIRGLEKDLENVKLEYDYLSSAENLIKFQNLYFNEELKKKKIEEIQFINENNLEIEKFRFIDGK